MPIITNKHGHILEEFIFVNTNAELEEIKGIGGGHALIFYNDKLLLCYNKYRNNWELPGGGKEANEKLNQCVIREIAEETGQIVSDLTIKGVTKTFIPRMGKTILWAVFAGKIDDMLDFEENEETNKILFWDMKSFIDIDEVELKIIQLVLE